MGSELASCFLQAPHNSSASNQQPQKRSKLEELMEKDKAAKKAKLEREKALGAASKAQGAAGKAGNGRQDAPWLHPGITVKVCGLQDLKAFLDNA